MRWFSSMNRTIVSPSGMPLLFNSSIRDGRSSAFADTSPRYTPIHCNGYWLTRRRRSFDNISADFENSRNPLAIFSGLFPSRDSIGFSGALITTLLPQTPLPHASRPATAYAVLAILGRTRPGIHRPDGFSPPHNVLVSTHRPHATSRLNETSTALPASLRRRRVVIPSSHAGGSRKTWPNLKPGMTESGTQRRLHCSCGSRYFLPVRHPAKSQLP